MVNFCSIAPASPVLSRKKSGARRLAGITTSSAPVPYVSPMMSRASLSCDSSDPVSGTVKVIISCALAEDVCIVELNRHRRYGILAVLREHGSDDAEHCCKD